MTQTTPSTLAPATPIPPFDEAMASVMAELKDTLAALVAGLPGSGHRGVDVARSLGLDNKLAWQVVRLAQAAEPLAEVENVPTAPSVRRLLEAAQKRRVSRPILDRIGAAFAAFERCVAEHGGDREGLISLVNGVSDRRDDQFEVKIRRSLFRAAAHVWGLQARCLSRTSITLPPTDPAADETRMRRIIVSGNAGLRQVRRGTLVTFSTWLRKGTPGGMLTPEEAAKHPSGFEILHEFSSSPLPTMLPRASLNGTTEIEMAMPTAGLTGAVSLYMSHVMDNADNPRAIGHALRMLISVPTEEIVNDVLIPAGWMDPSTARVAVYGRRQHPEHVFEERHIDLLGQRESVSYLGVMDGIPPIPGAPRQADAVRHVLREHGALGTKFDVLRCRVQFPALHTLVAVHVEPAKRPIGGNNGAVAGGG